MICTTQKTNREMKKNDRKFAHAFAHSACAIQRGGLKWDMVAKWRNSNKFDDFDDEDVCKCGWKDGYIDSLLSISSVSFSAVEFSFGIYATKHARTHTHIMYANM